MERIRAKKVNKYKNKPCIVNGIKFISKKEGARYSDLLILQKYGHISNLKTQVVYPICANGKIICKYIADFTYTTKAGKHIVEDAKGVRTQVYKLKKKMFLILEGIEITEV
jgi:hypothetical protein